MSSEKKNPQNPANNNSERVFKDTDGLIDIIKNLLKSGSHASDSMCYSGSLFILSNYLHNAKFVDEMGPVYANLSFIAVSPSSTYKTPLIRMFSEIFERSLRGEMHMKSKFTTEGLMNYLHDYREKYEKKGEKVPRFNCMVLRDEASNLAKESSGNGRQANIWEFLSQSFDGKIFPYDTIRGGYQEYPEVWMSFWFSSTFTLFEYLNDDFWEQGFAFRSLFTRPEPVKFEPIKQKSSEFREVEEIISIADSLFAITKAEASEEWISLYNQYIEPIIRMGNDEIESLNTAEPFEMEKRSMKKYPEMAIKLSMIHCASRGGFEGDTLYLDEIDLKNAISDLDQYKENFISAYNAYVLKKKSPMKIEKLTQERDMVIKMIKEAPKEKRMSVKVEKDKEGVPHYYSFADPNGKFISKSYFLRKSRLSAKTMTEILRTLVESEILFEQRVESTGTAKLTSLYSLNPEWEEENSKEKKKK